MVELDKIDMKALKAAATELNESGLIDPKIKTTAVTKSNLVDAFLEAIEDMDEDSFEKLNDYPLVVEMNNFIIADEAVDPEPVKPAKEEKPAKAEKPAKEEKPAKAEKPAKTPKPAKIPRASVAKIMIAGANSNMGLIESHVLSSKGISDAEAKALRPDWRKMLKQWKDAGFVVELIDGRYYCKGK